MSRVALVNPAGIVCNLVEIDDGASLIGFDFGGLTARRLQAGETVTLGQRWDGALWLAAVPEVLVVSAVQMQVALIRSGLAAAVKSASSKSPELAAELEYNTTFRSDSLKIAALAKVIGKTPADVRALFELAASL
jgi:hypothetical protein